MKTLQSHTISPVYNSQSQILILGTMPSPKSKEVGFYYSHPQNRFWKLLATILQQLEPITVEQKQEFLLTNKIALWDVLARCEISGASDSSIKNPVVNDFSTILNSAKIKAIFTTGKTAASLYQKYCYAKTGITAISLLSTSSANCRFKISELVEQYQTILKYLK